MNYIKTKGRRRMNQKIATRGSVPKVANNALITSVRALLSAPVLAASSIFAFLDLCLCLLFPCEYPPVSMMSLYVIRVTPQYSTNFSPDRGGSPMSSIIVPFRDVIHAGFPSFFVLSPPLLPLSLLAKRNSSFHLANKCVGLLPFRGDSK